jgi:hypothetical protein
MALRISGAFSVQLERVWAGVMGGSLDKPVLGEATIKAMAENV